MSVEKFRVQGMTLTLHFIYSVVCLCVCKVESNSYLRVHEVKSKWSLKGT